MSADKPHAAESATPETVDHPAHYGGADSPYEAIKVIRAWGAGFAIGNAIKYICRAGRKPGQSALQDLQKARWYLDDEIRAIEEAATVARQQKGATGKEVQP